MYLRIHVGDVVNFASLHHDGERRAPEPVSRRDVHFVGHDEALSTPIFDSSALHEDYVVEGPAIITTESTTYLIEPGWRVEPTPQGAVWLLADGVTTAD